MVFCAVAVFGACRPPSKSETKEPVGQQSSDEALPTLEPSVRDPQAEEARKRQRPGAKLAGTVALRLANKPSCLAVRVHERFLLTSASCVVQVPDGWPRPAYVFGVAFDIAWHDESSRERVATLAARAVYPHPSWSSYLEQRGERMAGFWTDREALSTIADLALVEIVTKADLSSLPIVKFASTLPFAAKAAGAADLLALQGDCLPKGDVGDTSSSEGATQDAASKGSEQPSHFLAGGRLVRGSWNQGQARGYLADAFPIARALFDCEALRGAPVVAPAAEGAEPELLGLTSWMHPDSVDRGVTWVAGKAEDRTTVAGWIAERVAAPSDFVPPTPTARITCAREVVSGLAKVAITIPSWDVRVAAKEAALVASLPSFDMKLRLLAPDPGERLQGVTPLVEAGQPPWESTIKMFRDVRYHDLVRFVGEKKFELGGQQVSVSLLSTDGRTGLVTLAAMDSASRKERTVNIYLETLLGGLWCKSSDLAATKQAPAIKQEPATKP
jgi:hypothetical protein